jgi:hypothetical protein
MFRQDEADVVNRNSRGGDDSDASSTTSNVPTSMKNRGQTKRVIGGDGIIEYGLDLSRLKLGSESAENYRHNNLPGLYSHVSLFRSRHSILTCRLEEFILTIKCSIYLFGPTLHFKLSSRHHHSACLDCFVRT